MKLTKEILHKMITEEIQQVSIQEADDPKKDEEYWMNKLRQWTNEPIEYEEPRDPRMPFRDRDNYEASKHLNPESSVSEPNEEVKGMTAGGRAAKAAHEDEVIKGLKQEEKKIFNSGVPAKQLKGLLEPVRDQIKARNLEIIARETEGTSEEFQKGFRFNYGLFWNLDGGVVSKRQRWNKNSSLGQYAHSLGPAFGGAPLDNDEG
tara:strand:- start:1062 stop:1676 length:615 start_codon:yes stop_codon:yes gene_type:complete